MPPRPLFFLRVLRVTLFVDARRIRLISASPTFHRTLNDGSRATGVQPASMPQALRWASDRTSRFGVTDDTHHCGGTTSHVNRVLFLRRNLCDFDQTSRLHTCAHDPSFGAAAVPSHHVNESVARPEGLRLARSA
jgi:hypothetical protein